MVAAVQDLEHLKKYLSETAPFYGVREGHPSGVEVLDRLLGGGLPQGALTLLTGERGAGRLRLAALLAKEETQRHRPVAWIDGRGTLYPPALANMGVDLDRVLMVQSESERIMFAAEQIALSGAFGVVIASGLERRLTPPRARRLQTAAETANISVVLTLESRAADRITNAALKLEVQKRGHKTMVEIKKDRSGHATGRRALLPATSVC